jgi:hypothetical protein
MENPEEEKPRRGLGPASGNTGVEPGDSAAEQGPEVGAAVLEQNPGNWAAGAEAKRHEGNGGR